MKAKIPGLTSLDSGSLRKNPPDVVVVTDDVVVVVVVVVEVVVEESAKDAALSLTRFTPIADPRVTKNSVTGLVPPP